MTFINDLTNIDLDKYYFIYDREETKSFCFGKFEYPFQEYRKHNGLLVSMKNEILQFNIHERIEMWGRNYLDPFELLRNSFFKRIDEVGWEEIISLPSCDFLSTWFLYEADESDMIQRI